MAKNLNIDVCKRQLEAISKKAGLMMLVLILKTMVYLRG